MIFYYQQRAESARAGSRIIGVRCDQCGCDYYYELSRLGVGVAVAPYGIGKVESKSKAAADRELSRQLSTEAELVPCPQCKWINQELVRGYRRGQYRWMFQLGPVVAAFGIAMSLVIAWFISIGPPGDRNGLPYVLIGGPVAFIAWAALVLLVQAWLRGRIRPNLNHPLEPQVPAGTPQALLLDEATGNFRPADLTGSRPPLIDDSLELRLGRDSLVAACCQCLQPPTAVFNLTVTNAITVPIPMCQQCVRRMKSRERWIWFQVCVATAVVLGIAVFTAKMLFARSPEEIFIVAGAIGVVAIVITSFIIPRILEPARVAALDTQRGIVKLRFDNPEFVQRHRDASA